MLSRLCNDDSMGGAIHCVEVDGFVDDFIFLLEPHVVQ